MLVDDSKLHFQADFQMMQFMNKQLRKYEPIWKQLDYIIVLEPENFFYSYKWRLEAEQKVYKTTGYGMADEQVLSMVSYYWKCLHPKVYVRHAAVISSSSISNATPSSSWTSTGKWSTAK